LKGPQPSLSKEVSGRRQRSNPYAEAQRRTKKAGRMNFVLISYFSLNIPQSSTVEKFMFYFCPCNENITPEIQKASLQRQMLK
jgi:hypothetical protein